MPTDRRTFLVSLGALTLAGLPVPALAASAVDTFTSATKAELGKMRATIKRTRAQRKKNKNQAAAARKYTIGYDRTYSQMKSLSRSDASKLRSGSSKGAGKSTVDGAIKRFEMRIAKLEKAQETIATDIRKIKDDQKKFWAKLSKMLASGKPLTPGQIRQLKAGLALYGTKPGMKVSLEPGKKPRSYKGGVVPEMAYLRAMSAHIRRLTGHYKKALRVLKAKLAAIKDKSRKAKNKKRAPAPITDPKYDM